MNKNKNKVIKPNLEPNLKPTPRIIAKKSLGQNFLEDGNYKRKILENTQKIYNNYTDLDLVEIGAGKGDLTMEYLKINESLKIYEIDEDLITVLTQKFPNNKIINCDFTKVIPELEYCFLVSNLPYYIGSRLIVDLIINNKQFPFAFILQKEVANKVKITNDITFFGAVINIFYESKVEFLIPPSAFYPAPKVYSALLTAKPKVDKTKQFEGAKTVTILKKMFFKPNKTLYNNLIFGGIDKTVVEELFETTKWDKNTRTNWGNYLDNLTFIYNFLTK